MNVAVILSGCGFMDGAEIHESVLTLLALDRARASVQCLAPNIDQHHVSDHLTQQACTEKRNVLIESARIARGHILDISQANPNDYDALILPGGYGAASSLSDFAIKGSACAVQPDVLRFAQAFAAARKPVGFICIAPALIPLIYGNGAHLTIGNDAGTAQAITAMGGVHENCSARDIIIDHERKIVSTPAYMLAQSIAEAATGIEKLVSAVLEMA